MSAFSSTGNALKDENDVTGHKPTSCLSRAFCQRVCDVASTLDKELSQRAQSEPHYRIKSKREDHLRSAMESELSALG